MIKLPRFRKKDVIELSETRYCVQINDRYECFPSKSAMVDFIRDYSEKNVIYSLAMFRADFYNLIK